MSGVPAGGSRGKPARIEKSLRAWPRLRGFSISTMTLPPRKTVTVPADSLTVRAVASVTAVVGAAA
jgi:hypothetical protein